MFSSDERFLIIAAHPDDEILGCGGTLALAQDVGIPCRIVFLADGVTARYKPEEFLGEKAQAEIAYRKKCAIKAMQVVGISSDDIFFSSNWCCRLDQEPLIDLTKSIERHIQDFKPTRLFTHAEHDPNIDHQISFKAVLPAIRPLRSASVRSIYAFEVLSSTEWNPVHPFQPSSFFDISQVMDKKIESIRCYDEEMLPPPHPRSVQAIKSLAVYRGAQVGVHFAEGFQLIRSLDL